MKYAKRFMTQGSKRANGVIDSIAGYSHLSDGFFMSACSSAAVYGPSLELEFKTAAPSVDLNG